MDYDINDPELDFAGREEALISALKGARSRKEAASAPGELKIVQGKYGPIFLKQSIGDAITQGINRYSAGDEEKQAMAERGRLNAEQGRRVDALTQQLTTPGMKTVRALPKALQGGGGGLDEEMVDTQVPLSPVEESQRRMGLAMKGARLPMARGMMEKIVGSEMDMPEKVALAQSKAQERLGEIQMRLEDRSLDRASREQLAREGNDLRMAMANDNNALRMTLGQMAKSNQGANNDLKNELTQLKIEQARKVLAEGTPAQQKAARQADERKEAGVRASSLVDQLETSLDKLEANGGITVPGKGIANVLPWASTTVPGQVLGRALGTKNQSERNKIENVATNLVLELKQLKGLGASQMNSNLELQKYLAAVAGGASDDIAATRAAVKNARALLNNAGSSDKSTADGDLLNRYGVK